MKSCFSTKNLIVIGFAGLLVLGVSECKAIAQSTATSGAHKSKMTNTREAIEKAEKTITTVVDIQVKAALTAICKALHEINKKADLAFHKNKVMCEGSKKGKKMENGQANKKKMIKNRDNKPK